jgi:hypothetical protein
MTMEETVLEKVKVLPVKRKQEVSDIIFLVTEFI